MWHGVLFFVRGEEDRFSPAVTRPPRALDGHSVQFSLAKDNTCYDTVPVVQLSQSVLVTQNVGTFSLCVSKSRCSQEKG